MSYNEITKITGVKTKTISTILSRWKENCFNVVSFIRRRKRKAIMTTEQEMVIVNSKVLMDVAHLTIKQRIPALRVKYGVPNVSERTLARIYHRHGIRYRRASYYYNKKFTMERELSDRQQVKATEMARDLALKKSLIYIDESSFNLWTPSNYLWMGKEMNFPLSINRGQSVTCIGAVDEVEGLVHYYIFVGSNNTQRFLHFLTGLVEQKLFTNAQLIMDNLSIHKSRGVQEFFVRHPNLQQSFLPPYSSAMNPIEKLWLVLKGRWRKHLVQHAMELFTPGRTVRDIQILLEAIKPETVRHLCTSHYKTLAKSIRGNLV